MINNLGVEEKVSIRLVAFTTVKFHSGVWETLLAGIKTFPESKPPGMGLQGWAKVDWVMLWFPGLHNNKIKIWLRIRSVEEKSIKLTLR